ncbi:MAG: LCP family protein [Clostridiales Family XIII bacterium]|jgi:LCP family protein required for cell wall assembly|nr:LCP family protein [Clostridiales Family XIII bacterium]
MRSRRSPRGRELQGRGYEEELAELYYYGDEGAAAPDILTEKDGSKVIRLKVKDYGASLAEGGRPRGTGAAPAGKGRKASEGNGAPVAAASPSKTGKQGSGAKKNGGPGGGGGPGRWGFLKTFLVGFAVLLLLLVPVQFAVARLMESPVIGGSDVLPDDIRTGSVSPEDPNYEAYTDAERLNFLILGVNGGLTDTIMLGSYDMDDQRVDVISVPRDTYYDRPSAKNAAQRKLNAVYGKEGAAGTAKAVSDVLGGIPIHYYAVVKYAGVAKAVDALNGVPVHISIDMNYDDAYDKPPLHIHFKKGDYVLNGEDAMKFLRFRKNNDGGGYPNQDIGRIQAQQDFVKAAIKKSLGLNLPKVVTAVMENMESDMTLSTALKLAARLKGFDTANIHGHTLPGEGRTKDGLSYWIQDKAATEELVDVIYHPEKAVSGGAISGGAVGS